MRNRFLLFAAILICVVQAFDSGPRAQLIPARAGGPPPGPIPATLFGMAIIFPDNWPTVAFSSRKGSGMSWHRLEPERGQFKWARLDQQVSSAQHHGATYLYTSNKVPRWAASDPRSCKPAFPGAREVGCTSGVSDIKDWDDFVTALATRYKGRIQAYELWNEPDQDFTGPMAELVLLTQHMHDIIRRIDPGAVIVAPAPVKADWSERYWAAGGVRDVDAVSIHGYPKGFPAKPETIGPRKAEPMKAIMAKYGLADKPLWDTEASWGDASSGVTDPQEQAAFVARFYLLHWSSGFSRFYWYSWDDNGDGPGGVGWGTLFNPNTHTALPAAGAYQEVYNWMVGATMTGSCTVSADSTWICPLTRAGGYQALAIWNTAASKAYVPPSQYTHYRDLAGNTFPIRGPVTIGSKPLLVTTSGLPVPPANVRPTVK